MTFSRSVLLTGYSHRSIEDAVGNAFMNILTEAESQGDIMVYVLKHPFFKPFFTPLSLTLTFLHQTRRQDPVF